jgi:hypothetical protein
VGKIVIFMFSFVALNIYLYIVYGIFLLELILVFNKKYINYWIEMAHYYNVQHM